MINYIIKKKGAIKLSVKFIEIVLEKNLADTLLVITEFTISLIEKAWEAQTLNKEDESAAHLYLHCLNYRNYIEEASVGPGESINISLVAESWTLMKELIYFFLDAHDNEMEQQESNINNAKRLIEIIVQKTQENKNSKKEKAMSNPITEFIEGGNDISSAEGRELLIKTDRAVIAEAANENNETLQKIAAVREASDDVMLRRKILLALSD
jgi:hypothetical protein